MTKDEALMAVLKEFFPNIQTLESQNNDNKDFHEVPVWSLKSALETMYELGKLEAHKKDNPFRIN